MYVHVHAYAGLHEHTFMRRLEDSFGHHYLGTLVQGLLLIWNSLTRIGWLASELQGLAYFFLLSIRIISGYHLVWNFPSISIVVYYLCLINKACMKTSAKEPH